MQEYDRYCLIFVDIIELCKTMQRYDRICRNIVKCGGYCCIVKLQRYRDIEMQKNG